MFRLNQSFVPSFLIGALIASTSAASPQETMRVSVDSAEVQGNEASDSPSISADGRYVSFDSGSSNLVGGDTNGAVDVFVRDRQSGTTVRVSVSSAGAQGNDWSGTPSISADGRYVAFESFATNLVSGDTNRLDVFVRDRQSGTTERVSVSSAGAQGNDWSGGPSISADGRYVAFESLASNLVSGDTNAEWDIFVRDRQSGTTERVSIATSGAQGAGWNYLPSISADGRYVVFYSEAADLASGDTNGLGDILVRDRQLGTTELISVSSAGAQANGFSYEPSISADGHCVAFHSWATNLVSGDTNDRGDVFVHDLQSGTTERVSVSSAGAQGNYESGYPSISADGRYVTFYGPASNLVSGDTNGAYDVFVRDRQSSTTERVSVDSAGAQGNGYSYEPSISADGRYVAFWSYANDLVSGDTNEWYDVFVRDRGDGIGTKYCTANANSTGSPADIAASGSASSGANNLTLTSSPVPNQNGIFAHGANQTQIPFGNGFQCATGGIVRGSVVMGVGNVATYTYDNSNAEHSLAAFVGTTRNFQYWFRDPMGGGALFNTSNAVSIAILP